MLRSVARNTIPGFFVRRIILKVLLTFMILFLVISCARPPALFDESHNGRQYEIHTGFYNPNTPYSPEIAFNIEVDTCQTVRMDVLDTNDVDAGIIIDTVLCAGQYSVFPRRLRRIVMLPSGVVDTQFVSFNSLTSGIYFVRTTKNGEESIHKIALLK